MKYFSPSYWFKLWLLSAQLFSDQTKNTNAMLIDKNKDIKNWANKNNNSLSSNSLQSNFLNSAIENITNNQFMKNQARNIEQLNETNLDLPRWDQNLTQLKKSHKIRQEKRKNRVKRQVTPNPKPTKEILKLKEKLIIDRNNRVEYQNSFRSVINELINYGIFIRVSDLNILVNHEINLDDDDSILALNPVRYGYFRLPVQIRYEVNQETQIRNLELVLRTDNLYLQGFIVTYHPGGHLPDITNYYHFDFRNINMNLQPIAVRDGSVPLLRTIQGIESIQLSEISPDYRDLLRPNDENVTWNNIFTSFLRLTNDINIGQERPLGNLAQSLGNVIVVTAEALRFWSLHTHIIQQLINNPNGYIVLGRNRENSIYSTLISWSEESRTQSLVIDLLSTPPDSRPNSPEQARNILVEYGYLRRRDNEPFINLLARILILPINDIINVLAHSNIRVILNYFIRPNLNNCGRKQLSDLKNDNYWHEKFCDLKPQTNKISGKITIMKVLDEHTQGGNLKAGTMYIGTTNGVYLILNNGNVHKFNGLNFPITSIKLDRNGSAYVTNKQEEVYHLDLVGWGSKKLDKVASSNLEKELKVNYNWIPEDEIVCHNLESVSTNIRKSDILYINLGRINPVDNYKKLEFLGDVYSDGWGTQTKWGSWVYDSDSHKGKLTSDLSTVLRNKNNEFHDMIINQHVTRDINMNEIENKYASFLVQHVDENDFIAWVEGWQKFGITWYWEDNNYYLQVITFQYLDWRASSASPLWQRMRVGNGIRLSNDDYNRNTDLDIDKEKIPELNLYYDDTDKKHDFTYIHDWYYNHTGNKIIKTFNLSKINPVDYKKIEFLGDNENFKLSRVSWGNTPYYSSKNLNDFKNQSLYEIIKNYKFDETNQDKIADYTTMVLQPKTTEWWSNAWLEWSQSLGLTWYWEDNYYYLQVISSEYANDGGSLYGGSLFMGIGKGIRLYNDDVQDVETVNENTDSWKNNEIINVINNEENTENITSTANIEPSNNFDINDINSILNFQNQSIANVSSTNIPTI